ncbi:thyroid receptor-interacting protein 6-like isoform X3 [Hemitrygon akajei]|uniref:thyroid receptor-interacting protein 6-like isoform X3 n=1 Tax=Hemitrygon akajei TaxID=2704970 RepID=UPI003BF9416E
MTSAAGWLHKVPKKVPRQRRWEQSLRRCRAPPGTPPGPVAVRQRAPALAPPLAFGQQQRLGLTSPLRNTGPALEQNGGLSAGPGRARYPSPQTGPVPASCSDDPRLSRPSLVVAGDHRYTAGREDGTLAPWNQTQPQAAPEIQTRPREKVMNRPSSIDAEIDCLTSMLADMQNNSPFGPRPRQNYDSGPAPFTSQPPPTTAPVPPPAPPKHTPPYRPLGQPAVAAATRAPRSLPQPVAAPYSTSTSAGPPPHVQVRVAQPVPTYAQPPRQASAPETTSSGWFPTPAHYPAGPDPRRGPEGVQALRRTDLPSYRVPGHPSHLAGKKGAYGEELPPAPAPPSAGHPAKASYAVPGGTQQQISRPEEELDRITKKLVHDMNNPPSEEYFGRCARCGENVVGDGTGCVAMDQVFHVECFTCMTCRCRLRGRPFYAVDRRSYCESCYINTLEQCSVCSKAIMDRILRAMGRAYHPQCFTCVVCHRCLDGIPFTVDATSQIHCIEDFHMKFAPRCSVCAKPIMPEAGQEETVRIVALDRSFHVNCYKCEDCGFVLSSEGEGCGCYPLDGHVLCKSCSARRIQHLSANVTTDC